jgi:predicted SnoaL-like aldol condensation-catalyzing enzyme
MRQIDFIYHAWDERLSNNDAQGLLELYAVVATLESPLVPHLMQTGSGILHGHDELRAFFQKLAERKPEVRRYYRAGYFTDGRILMWEYPRETPDGEQMDFVEVMEINGGLIQRHRVYWGWFGVNVLQANAYHR